METSLLSLIVPALAALGGVALTARVQSRSQARNQLFLASSETLKNERERRERDRVDAFDRLMAMHKLVSKIQRECSVTTLTILWCANTTEEAYDARYLALCGEADESLALAQFHEPTVFHEMEKMLGQMNIFWGNFKSVLHRSAKGRDVDHLDPALTKAHAAAAEVSSLGDEVKRRLARKVAEMHGGG